MSSRPVVLVILDGWGLAPATPGNAIAAAHTPNMDSYLANYPSTQITCWGNDVGLPEGQMGNSEVGHMNIGAGFVVYQSITRIDRSIEDGSFGETHAFNAALEHAKSNDSRIHLIGLVGDGGVHAHHRHWSGLLSFLAENGSPETILHAIMDGRDTEPTSGAGFLKTLIEDAHEIGVGTVGTISGRYFAMDRDRRWDRTGRAWNAIVHGGGASVSDPMEAIDSSYANGTTDEFIEPTIVDGVNTCIQDNDAVIFVNFRSDRMRQLVSALTLPDFCEFDRGKVPENVFVTTMTQYETSLPVEVAFPPEDVANPLAKVVSEAELRQFHLAETEKYAHVTYFINGGREKPFDGEDRKMVQSPDVATYDMQPEMSAPEVTDVAVAAIASGDYGFMVINFANGDMVGHTGVFDAAVEAVEAVDRGLGRIVEATLNAGGVLIVTADHGNAEELLIPGTDDVWTAHTMNPVPLVVIAPDTHPVRNAEMAREGRLADIAPTALALLGLDVPEEMTGRVLFET